MIRSALLASIVTGALLTSSGARALTIDFSLISGDTLTADQAAAFQTAANAWSSVFTNNVTLSIGIGFTTALQSNVLGSTSAPLLGVTAANYRAALTSGATSAHDQQAVASLPATTSSTILVTPAQAKAIGFSLPSTVTSDGSIQFNSSFAYSTARNADGTVAAGTYDLIGVAEHEIGHALGFVSGIDYNVAMQSGLDVFRYAAAGVSSFSKGAAAYFSIDNGVTALASFSDGATDQASHWLQGTVADGVTAVMGPELGNGATQNITSLDVEALDVVGWNTVAVSDTTVPGTAAGSAAGAAFTISTVPLPGTAWLFGLALVAFGAFGVGAKRRTTPVVAA